MNPFVTLILPIRNEAESIQRTLNSVLEQDYAPELMELLVVDGQSTDGTPEIVARLIEGARLSARLLKNPGRIVPTGLNIALRQAHGEVIIRVDGHTVIASDYVRQCVAALQSTGAENVGGRMNGVGANPFGRAIAVATSSPFGVGGGRFHVSDQEEWVDTVYMGAFPRRVFEEVGLFDEELVRDQDEEFNYRLRAAGGKVLLQPKIRSEYTVRSSPTALWRQYFQYGFWKIRVLQKHILQMSLRQFVPPAFVLGLILSALLALLPLFGASRGSAESSLSFLSPFASFLFPLSFLIPLLYLLANLTASLVTSAKRGWEYLPRLPFTFAILHVSYGLGFLLGLLRFVHRWGDRIGRVPDWSPGRRPRIEPLVAAYAPSLEGSINAFFKRLFDMAISGLGLLFLSPWFAIIGILVRHESAGPVFTWGARIGRHGKPFNILKFRTTYEHPRSASDPVPSLAVMDDKWLTPLGRWLRATKLSELPQLWNVLTGEMSMVGPRPEVAQLVRSWPDDARQEVLSLRPGITSPASITYRDEERQLHSLHASNLMDDYLKTILPNKLRLDQLYVRNHTFLGDLDVIFLTLATLLPMLGESKVKTETLYNGFLSRFIRRYVSWFTIDSLVAFAAVSVAALLWRMEGPLELGWPRAVQLGALMALIFSLVNSLRGLGRISWHSARPAYAFDILLSSAITTFGILAMNWFWPSSKFFPRGMVCVAGVLAFLGFLAVRYRERLFSGLAWRWLARLEMERSLGERVLIVGAGECGLLAGWLIGHSQLASAFSVSGLVDDDPRKEGLMIDGHRVFGLTSRIPELVGKLDIGVILFAIENIRREEEQRILDLCSQTPARLVVIPDLLALLREQLMQADLSPHTASPRGTVPTLASRRAQTPGAPLSGRTPELGGVVGKGQD
jgi:lipopolysaccharide/colanic/teichoic acid biosynthesis glycosyltransferase/GT2 family glycosyltransferase